MQVIKVAERGGDHAGIPEDPKRAPQPLPFPRPSAIVRMIHVVQDGAGHHDLRVYQTDGDGRLIGGIIPPIVPVNDDIAWRIARPAPQDGRQHQ